MIVKPHPTRRGFGVLHGAALPQVYHLLGRFPSKAFMEAARISLQLTPPNVQFLDAELPGLDWQCPEVDAIKSLDRQADNVRAMKAQAMETGEVERHTDYVFKTKPYTHQLLAFELRQDAQVFGYFMEMGTGKSKALIDDIADLRERGLIDMAVILAPNGVHVQWITGHLPAHFPDRIPMVAAYYRASPKAAERDALKKVLEEKSALKIITVNLEALSVKSGEEFLAKVLKDYPGRVLLAIDESSKIKTPGSSRTKAAHRLGKLAQYRRILSGSPVTKGVEDLYAQLKFLDERLLGFTSFYTFRNRYCVVTQQDFGGRRVEKIVGYQRLDELQHKLEGWTFRVRKDECLDLPPKVYVQRYVELTPEQRQLYKQLSEELIVTLADGRSTTAPLAIVKLLRLQQLICGHLPADNNEGMLWSLPPAQNPRMGAAFDLIEDSQGKVIVWARFKPDILGLMERLKPFNPVSYYGDTKKGYEREKAIKDFVEGDAGVWIASQQAGGIGIDGLQKVTTDTIYYSNTFNAEDRWQSEDRAHRSGLLHKVTYHDLVAKGTPDGKILKALQAKKNIADLTIDGIKELLIDDMGNI